MTETDSALDQVPLGRMTKDELYSRVVELADLPEKDTTSDSPLKKHHLIELVGYLEECNRTQEGDS